jgi:sugar lactone lactonase YvrE
VKSLRSNYARTFAAALFSAALVIPSSAQVRPVGDSEFFAAVPAPGYPEGIAVRGDRVYVSGPANFGMTDTPKVWAFDLKSRALVAEYPVQFANPYAGMRGLSCIAFGPDGKLYAVEPFVGIIRMHVNPTNQQEVYATFPPPAGPSLLNDLDFDSNGNLYVTDSFQGIVYRVPAGGGAATVWFQDPRLLGNPGLPFGVNGIRVDAPRNRVLFTVTVREDFSGALYSLPLVNQPAATDLVEVHVFGGPLPAPDGLALDKSGRIYVALAGANAVSVLSANGTEERVFEGPARISGSPAVLPWANPANIAFDQDQRTIFVTNHASLVPYDASLFAVFDVVVAAKGSPQ